MVKLKKICSNNSCTMGSWINIILLLFLLFIIISCGSASVLNSESTYKEYDIMHPQLLYRQSASNDGHRVKRGNMPSFSFLGPSIERHGDYWNNNAQETLKRQLDKNILNKNVARNIILFMGDGMSIPTITATRVYMGGEEKQLSFERFPYIGLSKTYCTNTQVADSACTATAYLGGVKGNYATIGVTAAVQLNDCKGENVTANHVNSIAKWAQDYGMSTGFVTTTQVTHASPAGVYAHTANRNWESNQQLLDDGGDPEYCTDVAQQLINGEVGRKLKVIMGGGRKEFLPKETIDIDGKPGKRTDGINLIKQWKRRHYGMRHGNGSKHKHPMGDAEIIQGRGYYVESKEELLSLPVDAEYVFGLFSNDHMPFTVDQENEDGVASDQPTLEQMVEKALDVLEKDQKGYFLFVEGGRIDHGHHNTQATRAFKETVEFSKAIDLARRRTNIENTLIVVTSDHSHTMSIAGYSSRGNDILGINDSQNGEDNLPYATISYANGPGHTMNMANKERKNLRIIDMHDNEYAYPSLVPLAQETHGGDDVGVFASGPWAHLFSGVYEQNFIPHAMGYAACIGNGITACKKD